MNEPSILSILSGKQSKLAQDASGRQVVLKPLDPDCMQNNLLHPQIHDRLEKECELAHPGVANLFGVERRDGRVMLVWEYLPGITLQEWAGTQEEFREIARDLISSIQTLHNLGIIHGGLHEGNVILDANRRIKLTHISPLLYHDPSHDVADLAKMLNRIAMARDWPPPARNEQPRDLAELLAEIAGPNDLPSIKLPPQKRWPLAGALGFLLAAIAAAGVLALIFHGEKPEKISPPQAPVENRF